MADREETRRRWEQAFKQALEHDSWGQIEEASEGYDRLRNVMANECVDNQLGLPNDAKSDLQKMSQCLHLRSKELQTDKNEGVGIEKMKKLTGYWPKFLVTSEPFPFQLRTTDIPPPAAPEISLGDDVQETEGGSLLPAQSSSRRGDEFLAITLDRWGFKDASGFIDPYVSVQVVNGSGELVESAQDTPISKKFKSNYIGFGNTIHIQTPLNALPKGAAIVLEFKHYKPKKKKVSTRAWCFLEMDEIAQGPVACEIYAKPADLKRKKLSLLSVKELYVHAELGIRRIG